MQNEERYLDAAKRMALLSPVDAAGVVAWQPAGAKLYEKLRSFIREVHEDSDYCEVKSPSIVDVSLFQKSGHIGKYQENMFFLGGARDAESSSDEKAYALRPMSCPNHIQLFNASRRSYRELPLKLFEFGEVYRNEPSGSLQTLFRMRQFCQDDSHVFSAERDIIEVVSSFLSMAQKTYSRLGFKEVAYAISLRPAHRFGDDRVWDLAENALRSACKNKEVNWEEQPGEGAFYGPKIELQVKDKLGRKWQLGTLQLDYVLPQRFNLSFINEKNEQEVPVLIHHAVLGSLERMIGILLEINGVNLPLFLQPHEAVVLPVSAKSKDYAEKVHGLVKQKWRHALLDKSDEPLGAKLRYWKNKGVPFIFVLGEKEQASFEVSENLHANLNGKLVDLAEWLAASASFDKG